METLKKGFLIPFYSLCAKAQLLCCFNYTICVCSLFICSSYFTNLRNANFVTVLFTNGCKTSRTTVSNVVLLYAILSHLLLYFQIFLLTINLNYHPITNISKTIKVLNTTFTITNILVYLS